MRIVNYLAEEFKKEHGVDLTADKMALQRLKEAAEKAKIELSSSSQTEINQPFISMGPNGQPLPPRHEADPRQARKPGQRPDQGVDEALRRRAQGCGPVQGRHRRGCPRRRHDPPCPKVVEEVTNFLRQGEPHKGVNPDEESIALGAAIQAGVLQGDVKDVVLLDVHAPVAGRHRDSGRCLHPSDRPQHDDPDEKGADLLDRRGQTRTRSPSASSRVSARWPPTTRCSASSTSKTSRPPAPRRAADRGDLRHRRQRHRLGRRQGQGHRQGTEDHDPGLGRISSDEDIERTW